MSRIAIIAVFTLSLISCSDRSPAEKAPPRQVTAPLAIPPTPAVEEEPPDLDVVQPEDTDSQTSPSKPTRAPASGKPMLLDFTRDHCMPCTIMAPWVEELRTKYAKQVDVSEINIDRSGNNELGIYFKVASIPTQVYVDKSGKVMSRHVGLATKAQMEGTLKRHGFVGGIAENSNKGGTPRE